MPLDEEVLQLGTDHMHRQVQNLNPSGKRIQSNEICRDYLRGVCTRKNCKYLHLTEPELMKRYPQSAAHYIRHVPGEATDTVPICVDFLKTGRCARAGCPYRHWWDPALLEGLNIPPPPQRRIQDTPDGVMDRSYLMDQLHAANRANEELAKQNNMLRAQNASMHAQLRGLAPSHFTNSMPSLPGHMDDHTPPGQHRVMDGGPAVLGMVQPGIPHSHSATAVFGGMQSNVGQAPGGMINWEPPVDQPVDFRPSTTGTGTTTDPGLLF